MFLKNKIIKENIKRKQIKNVENIILCKNLIAINKILSFKSRNQIINNAAYNQSILKYNNTCIDTGRHRGIVTEYKLSRHNFKILIDKKELPGIIKASW